MRFFEKIQKLDIFYKKLIVFSIIIALGFFLSVLIGKNFQKRVQEFNKERLLEQLNIQKLKEGVEKLNTDEIKEQFQEIANFLATTTTSTKEIK